MTVRCNGDTDRLDEVARNNSVVCSYCQTSSRVRSLTMTFSLCQWRSGNFAMYRILPVILKPPQLCPVSSARKETCLRAASDLRARHSFFHDVAVTKVTLFQICWCS
jgi:hypothetical protein